MPHHWNNHQRSVNNFWSCVVENVISAWSQTSTYQQLWTYISSSATNIHPTASRTVITYSISTAATQCIEVFLSKRTVKTSYILNNISVTTQVSVTISRVFWMALTAVMEPYTLCRRITLFPSPWRLVMFHSISKIHFSQWKPQGVSKRMWSVNLDASISGEYRTLGGQSGWPSEELGARTTTSLGASASAGNIPVSTSNHSQVFSVYSHFCDYVSI